MKKRTSFDLTEENSNILKRYSSTTGKNFTSIINFLIPLLEDEWFLEHYLIYKVNKLKQQVQNASCNTEITMAAKNLIHFLEMTGTGKYEEK